MRDESNVHPYIVTLKDHNEDLPSQYFVIFGSELIVECNSLTSALFGLFALHYVFDMNYHPRTNDSFLFIEEKIMRIQCSKKKSTGYTSITTGVSTFLDSSESATV